jgi:hypothetical protein
MADEGRADCPNENPLAGEMASVTSQQRYRSLHPRGFPGFFALDLAQL